MRAGRSDSIESLLLVCFTTSRSLMKTHAIVLAAFAVLAVNQASAFNSGSTGADGALTPNVSTTISLPASGVLNYTEINIPSGVTVRFQRNALNTPVTLLVSGNATIAGTLDLSGERAADSNGAGSGNVADDGLPGAGGPGGFGGGRGGLADPSTAAGSPRIGQAGIGPGGGRPTTTSLNNNTSCYGSSGSFGTAGGSVGAGCGSLAAATYGNPDLLPMVGGSGGSGGNGLASTGGSGGGGGGGALLLAVSGTLNVTGSILANGGHGGDIGHAHNMAGGGTVGGGGSGGAIRLVATTLSGNGPISAAGARTGNTSNVLNRDFGGVGRIRLEADNFLRTATTTPPYTTSVPGPLVVAGVPTIRIASVAGVNAPAEPTGNADIVLPASTPNPVAVVIESTNVPLGNTISLITTPPRGTPVTTISSALVGTVDLASASANINLDDGSSVLLATLSYSVSGPQQLALARYTEGEPVVAVELVAALNGQPSTVLITQSGRRVAM